ncbi:ABC transporter permease, partial [Akkermansia muciniphila]
MKNAYQKDIWRAICKGKKRFFSILLITALGVTMLTGLKAACIDLRNTADRFFDEQALFDLNIVSTLGLTVEDVAALQGLDGVAAAEGAYSETAYTLADGKRQSALVKTLSDSGINAPYLLEGTLPQKVGEIAGTNG